MAYNTQLGTLGDALQTSQDWTLDQAVTVARVSADELLGRKRSLDNLIKSGWQPTYAALFGDEFVESLAPHHAEAIEWHWNARIDLLEGRVPDYWAYFPIWSRGHMKSTIARRIAVVEAALSFAYDQPAYILYVSRNSAMAKKHALSIENLLTSHRVRQYCPQLSEVKRNVQGSSRGWQATFLNTKAGVYHFGGLDEGMAGGNVDDVRPTAMFFDDIDGREDSPVIAETRFTKLTTEFLPMRQANTLVFYPQNLIGRYSTQYRIWTGQARVLTNRKPTDPIPALIDPVFEQRTTDGGIIQDVITAGTPTWHKYGLERCQQEINTIGLPAFLRECHPAGTPIRLGSHKRVAIETIEAGDTVTSHRGVPQIVTEALERQFTGELVKVNRAGQSGWIKSTPNHPYFVARRPKHRWLWHRKSGGKDCKDTKRLVYEWAHALTLNKGDFMLEPLPIRSFLPSDGSIIWQFTQQSVGRPAKGNRFVQVSKSLCRLLGYFLAEGSAQSSSVSFDFHKDEAEYHADVVRLLREVFDVSASVSPSNGNGMTVECSSTIAAQFFLHIGVGSHHKCVPDWAFEASDECIKEILIGYMRGDGCKDKSGFSFYTVSEQLGEDLRLLMLRLGVIASVYFIKKSSKLPQGAVYPAEGWVGDINGGDASRLGDVLGYAHVSKGHNRAFIANGYVHRPINKIEREYVKDLSVYNLEVENDHSFLAENVASHNCQHLVDSDREGLIIHTYNDSVHAISESEFASVYRSPDAWKHFYKVPFNDWARTKTEKHANVAGYVAVASQNTAKPGLTFHIPLSFPPESLPEDVAVRLLSVLTPYAYGENGTSVEWKDLVRDAHLRANAQTHFDTLSKRVEFERSHLKAIVPKYARPILRQFNVKTGAMSHSEDTVRTVFNDVFGFDFLPANPHMLDCVEDINAAFKIDWQADHPFRPGIKGYTRTFIIVPDDMTQPFEVRNGVEVYPPRAYPKVLQPHELHDSDLMRFQFCNLRYAEPVLTKTGERIDEMLKINDDFFQGVQMIYFKQLLANIRLTVDEQRELTVAPQFRLDAIAQQKDDLTEEEYGRMLITRQSKLMMPKILASNGKTSGGRFSKFRK